MRRPCGKAGYKLGHGKRGAFPVIWRTAIPPPSLEGVDYIRLDDSAVKKSHMLYTRRLQ